MKPIGQAIRSVALAGVVGAGLLLRSIPRYIIEEHVSRYEEQARETKTLESAHR